MKPTNSKILAIGLAVALLAAFFLPWVITSVNNSGWDITCGSLSAGFINYPLRYLAAIIPVTAIIIIYSAAYCDEEYPINKTALFSIPLVTLLLVWGAVISKIVNEGIRVNHSLFLNSDIIKIFGIGFWMTLIFTITLAFAGIKSYVRSSGLYKLYIETDLFATGKFLFAVAVGAIGLVHVITGHFPSGLLNVDPKLSYEPILAYVNGAALIAAAILILSRKYENIGAMLAAGVWLLLLVALHLPKLFMSINVADEWTPTFEVAAIFAGALVLTGILDPEKDDRFKLTLIGGYLFGLSVFVFGILHLIFLDFIVTLIPTWIPFRIFWAYLVMIAFFASAISLFTRVWVRLSSSLLGLMFFLWFCTLHVPLLIANNKVEAQWTSLFVVLACSGVALLIAGSQQEKAEESEEETAGLVAGIIAD